MIFFFFFCIDRTLCFRKNSFLSKFFFCLSFVRVLDSLYKFFFFVRSFEIMLNSVYIRDKISQWSILTVEWELEWGWKVKHTILLLRMVLI